MPKGFIGDGRSRNSPVKLQQFRVKLLILILFRSLFRSKTVLARLDRLRHFAPSKAWLRWNHKALKSSSRVSSHRCFGRPFVHFPQTPIARITWPYHRKSLYHNFSTIGASSYRSRISSFRTPLIQCKIFVFISARRLHWLGKQFHNAIHYWLIALILKLLSSRYDAVTDSDGAYSSDQNICFI